MKKNFVLDTNVLLHDPNSINAFKDNNVIIPIYVLEEVDSFKKDLSELGRNARHVSRKLDELRKGGRLVDGVPLSSTSSGTLRVAFAEHELSSKYALNSHSNDNRILATALTVQKESPETPLIFISKDINLRIRASALGLNPQDYSIEQTDISELYSGISSITLPVGGLADLYAHGELPLPQLSSDARPYCHNSFAIVQDSASSGSGLVRIFPTHGTMKLI